MQTVRLLDNPLEHWKQLKSAILGATANTTRQGTEVTVTAPIDTTPATYFGYEREGKQLEVHSQHASIAAGHLGASEDTVTLKSDSDISWELPGHGRFGATIVRRDETMQTTFREYSERCGFLWLKKRRVLYVVAKGDSFWNSRPAATSVKPSSAKSHAYHNNWRSSIRFPQVRHRKRQVVGCQFLRRLGGSDLRRGTEP
jgi:hypothetical protein